MKTISGNYIYYLNGAITDVREKFQIEQGQDGRARTTSTRDAPEFGTKITVITEQNDDGFLRADIIFSKIHETRATYQFDSDKLYFSRFQNSVLVDSGEVTLGIGCLFFPLMRIFQGPTIAKVASIGRKTTVLVPSIESADAIEALLTPTFDERHAEQIGTENNLRIFTYRSQHYDENSEFRLRPDDLLHSYRFQQAPGSVWDVKLSLETT